MVLRIISGAQTGADQGGLRAAKKLGLATGGWMPKGFITLDGPRPDFAKEFGIKEHSSEKYPPRTEANVREADATLRFARDFNTPGEKCTLKAILKRGKPYLDIDMTTPLPVDEVRAWLQSKRVMVLNVSGNTAKQAPGIEAFVENFLVEVLAVPLAGPDKPT